MKLELDGGGLAFLFGQIAHFPGRSEAIRPCII